MPDYKIFTTPIDVRFRDIDAMNHVNNAVYFTYFEYGRLKFFYHIFEEIGVVIPTILAHTWCDFLIPVKLTDHPSLRMWVSKIGTKSFTLSYWLVNQSDESTVYAKGESVQVCYDYEKSVTIDLSGVFKELLSLYYHEP